MGGDLGKVATGPLGGAGLGALASLAIPGVGAALPALIGSQIFGQMQAEAQKRKLMKDLSSRTGRLAKGAGIRASQAATARGLTGGAGAAFESEAINKALAAGEAQRAQLESGFLQQGLQGMGGLASLLTLLAASPGTFGLGGESGPAASAMGTSLSPMAPGGAFAQGGLSEILKAMNSGII